MPGKVRSVLLGLEVLPTGRACNCHHNKKHRIFKGQLRVVVKNPGPASGEHGYCAACGQAMLLAAQGRLVELLAALPGEPATATVGDAGAADGDQEQGTRLSSAGVVPQRRPDPLAQPHGRRVARGCHRPRGAASATSSSRPKGRHS